MACCACYSCTLRGASVKSSVCVFVCLFVGVCVYAHSVCCSVSCGVRSTRCLFARIENIGAAPTFLMYGVATISRLLTIIDLFGRISSLL